MDNELRNRIKNAVGELEKIAVDITGRIVKTSPYSKENQILLQKIDAIDLAQSALYRWLASETAG